MSRKILAKCLIAVLVSALSATTAGATVHDWDNYTGDRQFSTWTNWMPTTGAPPGPGDTAIFDGQLSGSGSGDNIVEVVDGTAINDMQVYNSTGYPATVVDMTIGDGTTSSRFDLDQMSGDSLVVGNSFGDTATLNLKGGWLDTLDALIDGRATFNITGDGALWDSANVLVSGDTVTNTAGIGLGLQARINTHGNLDVGSDTGSGRVAVDGSGLGPGALWTVTGSVDVGPTGTSSFNFGQLTLQLGGRMSVNQNLSVHGAEVASTVTVQTGGDLDVTGLLQVGQYGVLELFDVASSITTGDIDVDAAGTLNWNGGTLHITDGRLRIDDSAFADLEIDNLTVGTGMTLKVTKPDGNESLEIGNAGNGEMTVENGGIVESFRGIIGHSGNANGTVTVRNGSTWTVTEQLRVGNEGSAHGTLNIESNSSVAADWVALGDFGTTDGTVTVDGIGSTLSATTGVNVGGGTVEGGSGTLTIRNGGTVNTFDLTIWSDGTVKLLGSEINATSFGNNYGGTFTHDDGTLTVTGGNFEPVPGGTYYYIDGADAADLPTVVLDGATTNVQPSALRVGYHNYGSLTLSNGSTMTVNGNAYLAFYTTITAEGHLTVDGVGSVLTIMGDLEVGDGRNGYLTVSGGGEVDSSGVGSLGRDVIGDDDDGNGTAHVHGDGSTWTTDTLVVGEQGKGVMEIGVSDSGGNVTTSGDAFIARETGSADSRVTVGAGGSWNVDGTLWVGGGTNADGAGDTALLTIGTNGRVTTSAGNDIKVWGPGEVHLDGGTLEVGKNLNLASGALTGYGTVDGDVDNNGLVALTAPISSTGDLTITGDYTQVSGTLRIEIGGSTAGEYDRLLIDGAATLDGTLDVRLVGLNAGPVYEPEAGDTFDIIDFASSTGTFDQIDLPGLDSRLGWDISDLYTTGELAVWLSGDANRDGTVNDVDATMLAANWGRAGATWANGDFNRDGHVNSQDTALMAANWLVSLPPHSAAVPEPSTLCLLAFVSLGFLAYRRRSSGAVNPRKCLLGTTARV